MVRRLIVVPCSHPSKIKPKLDHNFNKINVRSSLKVTARLALAGFPVGECRLFGPKEERPPDYQVEVHWTNEEKCSLERK